MNILFNEKLQYFLISSLPVEKFSKSFVLKTKDEYFSFIKDNKKSDVSLDTIRLGLVSHIKSLKE